MMGRSNRLAREPRARCRRMRSRRERSWLRRTRRWVTSRVTEAALAASPTIRPATVERLEAFVGWAAARFPVLSATVAANMRALGVYTRQAHRDYFRFVASHLAGVLTALRCYARSPDTPSREFREIVEARYEIDESFDALRELTASGRGCVLMGPHLANFVMALARVHHVAPLTIYMRYSKLVARREAKLRWCKAAGMSWIVEPPESAKRAGRLAGMTAAVRAGQTLYVTPDLVRKQGEGTPVRFFGREIYLPAGACVLAARAEAPLFILLSRELPDRRQRLSLLGPVMPDAAPGARERVRSIVQQNMQWFADVFADFVRERTGLWYSWADKRWTRLLRGDPRYARALAEPTPWPESTDAGGTAETAGA